MWAAFCFITLVFIKGVDAQKSHYGKEFVLGIIPSYNTPNQIVVDIASEKEGKVYYSIPYLNIKRNETLRHGHTSISINSSLTTYGNFTQQRGILISTDVHVTVVVTSFYIDVMDSYLALPVSALGLHYRAASYTPFVESATSNAEILIVAAYDNTNVTIRGNDGKTTSLNLNKLFVHQISSITDLSDVEIIASKPVSVISGTICAYVPHHVQACDMLLEQMIPSESWETGTFIVPPYYLSKGFLLKVMTTSSSTFCLKNITKTLCNSSRHLPEEEFLMGTEPVVVTSSGHISVVQYGLGEDYDTVGDEFMNLIPAIANYIKEYYFVVPTVYSSLTSYLSVIVPSPESNGLLLDDSTPFAKHRYLVPDINYTVLVFDIGVGYHTLKHSSSNVNFGAIVYGRYPARGYGFPLGFQFSGAKPTVLLTSTSSSSSSLTMTTRSFASTTGSGMKLTAKPTVLLASTSSSRSSSTMTTGSISSTTGFGQRKTCYSCDDMSHIELCDTIKHCADNEICYLESYVNSGRKMFRLGCLSSSQCFQDSVAANTMTDECVECCSDDYCNNKGCGESGLPARERRGPLCYDCHHVWSTDECNTIILCEDGQVCSIEEHKWGEHSYFKMGCSSSLCHPVDRSVHMSLRSRPVCHKCCKGDYCNKNCTRVTTGNEGSLIVG